MRRLALLGAALAGPAWADAPPATRPQRDVDVTYRATVGGQVVQQRTRSLAGAREVRIDTPSPGLYLIINHDAHKMAMVSDGDRSVLQMQYDPNRAPGAGGENQSFRRAGADTVAGLACTEWQTTDTAGRAVVACYTADGVMLRARSGDAVLVQAAKVVYGPLDPAIFAVPAGFRQVDAPGRKP